jgi:23S rRNA (adenine2503-C2)-methyltransferase
MSDNNIKGLGLEEIEQVLASWGEPRFRARQIFAWLYRKKASGFEQMSDLPQGLRELLKEKFCFSCLRLVRSVRSRDNTEKFLFQLKDKNLIEAVIIPAEGRVTGCISTQAGCKFSCRFCASGASGFKRNLSCAEIIEQALFLDKAKKPTHIVFMGTGEPLDNYDNVIKAARLINSKPGLNIGARRITISTCGVIPGIERLAKEGLQIELSVSLHAADDKTRSLLVPVNRKYPLKALLGACKEYIRKTNRQVTFEYVLIKGLNSALPDAQKLCTILDNLNCKVNLIPCNPIRELKVEPPNKLEILMFKDCLARHGLKVTLRRPRGQDIEAACGQLRLRYEKK